MSEEKKRRNSYADLGLMVAISLSIILIIKCLLFEVTWESIIWLVASIAYCVISYILDSEDKIIRHATTSLFVFSVSMMAFILITDRNVRPKMHAFEGAKVDSITEEEFIQDKDPELVTIIKDTTENDTSIVEEIVADSVTSTETDIIPQENQEENQENTEE